MTASRLPTGQSTARPLRVLTVTNMYPTASRPILGTFVGEEVASLRRRGISVEVLFIDGPAIQGGGYQGETTASRPTT
jgi:hypothetical protein